MTMTPRLRKLVLTAHIASSVGFLGTVMAFLALVVAGLTSRDEQIVRAAYLAGASITWSVIVPLSFASLLTGLVQSLGTPWGLFRHYWGEKCVRPLLRNTQDGHPKGRPRAPLTP